MNLSQSNTSTLVFYVNGQKVEDGNIDPEWTLLYYLRKKLGLYGTKLGCSEGGCGACTVMVSRINRTTRQITHLSVNACLAPLASVHGLSVTTVEGIGSIKKKLHPVQERIAKAHGTQCGFCTPGIVMSMYVLLRNKEKPTMDDLENTFQGNLCRCTGYRPILEAYRTFTEISKQETLNGSCLNGINCCKNNVDKHINGSVCQNGYEYPEKLFNSEHFKPYDPTQEPIFPPELAVSDKYDKQFLVIQGRNTTWYRPENLIDLIQLKQKYPSSKIVNGNTELGIEMKFKNCVYTHLIATSEIKEMKTISVVDKHLVVGSTITISELEAEINTILQKKPEYSTRILAAMKEMLELFAGKQIRNVGTIGGNIMTGSPISDLNPILMAANCKLDIISKDGQRQLQMDENFWIGYRKNIVKNNEILLAIYIPFTEENQYFKAYKQSKRRDDDIAIVNAAYFIEIENMKIANARMAYGGLAPTTVLAKNTSSSIIGKIWSGKILDSVFNLLAKEFPLDPSAPGGMVEYRKALCMSFFFKFYLAICEILNKNSYQISIQSAYKSAARQFYRELPLNSQFFFISPKRPQKNNPVGRPIVHQAAFQQATGEAVYCDDMPSLKNEVYICLLRSTRTHAKLVSINPEESLKLEGVVGFFSAADIPATRNMCGPIVADEEVFASEKVLCQGQVIGALAATNLSIAQKASELVKVEYQDLDPVIITIEEAIEHSSYFANTPAIIEFGDVEKGFAEADGTVEGNLRIGGQEHFYMETQNTIAVPSSEDDEIIIYSSTQHPTDLQRQAADVLGLSWNKIMCRVKRIGGGFGGKEARSCILALPAAFVAHKLKRPVRLSLERKEDMIISGQRHPFYSKYKAAYSNLGKVIAVEIDLYCNAGCSLDLSDAVMERAMHHFSNAIKIPNIKCRGFVCKTNLPSNTAFRGFGAPQAMLVGETIVHHIAESLNKEVNRIHELNFYVDGDITHFKQKIANCTIQQCWNQCLNQSQFEERKHSVIKFNSANRFRKRGLSIIPTMFGIAFSTQFLNQTGALVLVYSDGSVLISHGGTEMGQGLHTKMIQVASQTLNIPLELIHISETATDKVPNTSSTAASSSSDLNGMAVLNACEEIKNRLKPIIDKNPKGCWKDWVRTAYFERISLAVSGFYRTPGLGPDLKNNTEVVYNYFTYGVACSEVEIDCLTGGHHVLRTDIVMDLGESLNPAIDIGQVEGAFMQGYGLFTIEELIHSPEGILYSTGPGTYKIPSFSDIPPHFNVSLLKGSSNPRAVYSSKAVGEPPLFLASSVFFAIRQAVKSARHEAGNSCWFTFNSPATVARIRMACDDFITALLSKKSSTTAKPWNVVV